MEELRSTEVLDREILEDARKKAFKILKTADDSVQSQVKRWEKKTQKAIAEIGKKYETQAQETQAEIRAKGPLDRRRLRSETAEFFLRDAMDRFLKNLDHGSLTRILERELEERLSLCGEGEILPDEKPELCCINIGNDEGEAMFRRAVTKLNLKMGAVVFSSPKTGSSSSFPALILNTRYMRLTASVENAAYKLLRDKRAELAASLLGEGALND